MKVTGHYWMGMVLVIICAIAADHRWTYFTVVSGFYAAYFFALAVKNS